MKLLRLLLKGIFEKRLIYLLRGSRITIEKGGYFKVGKNVIIRNSKIYVKKGDSLIIGNNTYISEANISMIKGEQSEIHIGINCEIKEFDLSITKGVIRIGDWTKLLKGDESLRPNFEIQGKLTIGNYNSLRCSIWIRFNGCVDIGSRNAINEGTEIRSDENVKIGDYNQISYNCIFWDTNTHTIYKAEQRRAMTDKQYPEFGLEFEKPKTAPISIGNDCWIGKGVSVLKGSQIEDKCIVAYGTLISNITITKNKTIFNQSNLKIIDNQL